MMLKGLLALGLLAASATAQKVKGKVFDRLAIIWLENTDYDMAAGDREYAFFRHGESGVVDTA